MNIETRQNKCIPPPEKAFKIVDSVLPCLPGHQMVDALEEFIRLATQVPVARIATTNSIKPVARK